jgi:DDE superfamily endonuclease
VVKDGTPDRMQRLLYRVPWDAEAARDRLQQFVIERFGDPEAIAVLDETGIPKKGTRSVGVHKQYCGALGKIENCQVATLVTSATTRGHVFLDRQLFLPEEWCLDRARRTRAKVPAEVTFQTKPEQARVMLEHAWQAGVYGCSKNLALPAKSAGKRYIWDGEHLKNHYLVPFWISCKVPIRGIGFIEKFTHALVI